MKRYLKPILLLTLVLGLLLSLAPRWMANASKDKHCNHHKHHTHHGKHKHHPTTTHQAKTTQKHPLLLAYGNLRKALAADHLQVAKKAAKNLALAANATAKGKSGKHKKVLRRLTTAANAIAESPTLAAARRAFGLASKQFIAYLSNHRALATGAAVYECPMAKGYKKWVQFKSDMGNPYMGKRMLMCGSKTTLVP